MTNKRLRPQSAHASTQATPSEAGRTGRWSLTLASQPVGPFQRRIAAASVATAAWPHRSPKPGAIRRHRTDAPRDPSTSAWRTGSPSASMAASSRPEQTIHGKGLGKTRISDPVADRASPMERGSPGRWRSSPTPTRRCGSPSTRRWPEYHRTYYLAEPVCSIGAPMSLDRRSSSGAGRIRAPRQGGGTRRARAGQGPRGPGYHIGRSRSESHTRASEHRNGRVYT